MKVWYKIETIGRPYFKEMTLTNVDEIKDYLVYLIAKGGYEPEEELVELKHSRKLEGVVLKGALSAGKDKGGFLVEGGMTGTDGCLMVEDDEGNAISSTYAQLLIYADLKDLIFGSSSNAIPNNIKHSLTQGNKDHSNIKTKRIITAVFDTKKLGRYRKQILSLCKRIPLTTFINAANIMNVIEVHLGQRQRRRNLLEINDRLYVELVDEELGLGEGVKGSSLKVMEASRVKALGNREFYGLVERKVERLLMDKELARVEVVVLEGGFVGRGSSGVGSDGGISENSKPTPQHSPLNNNSSADHLPLTSHPYLSTLFSYLHHNSATFWPYHALTLPSIQQLYNIFFPQTNYKLSFFFNISNHQIKKVSLSPIARFSQKTLGRGFETLLMGAKEDGFRFRGRVFAILHNATDELRDFYKIPGDTIKKKQDGNCQGNIGHDSSNINKTISHPTTNGQPTSQLMSLQDLIQLMSSVGFKMTQISSIIRNFSLILNIYHLPIQDQTATLTQSISFQNIQSLYSDNAYLIKQLILPNNTSQPKQTTLIKKQLLMRILWQNTLERLSRELNAKTQDGTADLTRTKRFDLYVHQNALIDEKGVQTIQVEQGTVGCYEYLVVGRQLIAREYDIIGQGDSMDNQNQDNRSMVSNCSNPSKLSAKSISYNSPGPQTSNSSFLKIKQQIQQLYKSHLQTNLTSFNLNIISEQKTYQQLYKALTEHQKLKDLVQEILHLEKLANSIETYCREFFDGGEGKEVVERCYVLVAGERKLLRHQKEARGLAKFVQKILREKVRQLQSNQSQDYQQQLNEQLINPVSNRPSKLQNLSLFLKLTPNPSRLPLSPLHSPLRSPTSHPQQFFKSAVKPSKNLTLSPEPQPQPQPLSNAKSFSMSKTPKRSKVSMHLDVLIIKYLYGSQMKAVHRFMVKKEKRSKETFDKAKVKEQLANDIRRLTMALGHDKEGSQQNVQLSLNSGQRSQLRQLIGFDLIQDIQTQKLCVELQLPYFLKVQNQNQLQKDSVYKIISLFRRFKFRKNHNLHMFRKKFLKEIERLCKRAKSARVIGRVLCLKQTAVMRQLFKRLKLKAYLERLVSVLAEIYKAKRLFLCRNGFQKLKFIMRKRLAVEKVSNFVGKQIKRKLFDPFQTLVQGPYSLVVTSPSGMKKNIEALNIDNINKTANSNVEAQGNSNVKNIMQNNDKKSFSKNQGVNDGKEPVVSNKQQNQGQSQQPVKNQQVIQNNNSKQQHGDKNISNPTPALIPNQASSNPPSQIVGQTTTFPQPDQNRESLTQPPQLSINTSQSNDRNGLGQVPPATMGENKLPTVKQQPPSNQLSRSLVSQLGSLSQMVVNSVLSGSLVSYKSELSEQIKKEELFEIKDSPFFSFETWAKDTAAKFLEKDNRPCPILFRKYEDEKTKPMLQAEREIEEDRNIRDKISNASFIAYLKEYLSTPNNESIQTIITYQKSALITPLLKPYPIPKHSLTFKQTFNIMLKLSLFKNTSQTLPQLLNQLTKPLRDAYNRQKNSQQTVFQDEPIMNPSYESEYNCLRDEMFLQFAKQMMNNLDKESMVSLGFALKILTKSYCPSPKLFYPFMNYLKVGKGTKPQVFALPYENLLKFAQAIQGFKGASSKIYKQTPTSKLVPMTQTQHNWYLDLRNSQFTEHQCQSSTLTLRIYLYNRQSFLLRVCNESLRTIKRRVLNQLNMLQHERNFTLYEERGHNSFCVLEERQKAVDVGGEGKGKRPEVHLRVRQYYPIRFQDINSLRMFYLNMIGEEARMPLKREECESLVALSISFDEFQEERIANYMLVSGKSKLQEQDLGNIKKKLQQLSSPEQDKKICEFQYFKLMKQFNLLLAKSYKTTSQPLFNEIDRIIIKPKQLCLYSSTSLRCSISLYRIKSFYFDNNEIHIDLIYSDRDLGEGFDKKFHGVVKSFVVKGFGKIKELYEDLVYYAELLQLGWKP